jgi:hypothetical protein
LLILRKCERLRENAEYKLNALVLGAGFEYDFVLEGKVNPFIGVEFTGTF